MKRSLLLLIIVLLILGIAYISFTKLLIPKQTPLDQQINLKIGVLKVTGYDLFFIAKEKNFFKEEGINAELVTVATGEQLLDGILSNDLDMSTIPLLTVLNLEQKNPGNIKIIGSMYSDTSGTTATYRAIVKSDSSIKTLADLKGKKIAIPPTRSNINIAKIILKNFFNPEEVEIINLPVEEHLTALQNNAVDAIFTLEPVATIALSQNNFREIDNSIRPRYIINPYHSAPIVLSPKFIEKYPGGLEKLQRALIKTINFRNENRDETKKIIANYTGYSFEVVQKMNLMHEQLFDDIDGDAIQKLADIFFENDLLEKHVNISNMLLE